MAYNQPQVQATLGKLDDQTLLGMLNRPGGVLPPSTPMDIQQQLAKNAQTRQSQVATAGAPAQMPAVPSAPSPNTPAGISGLQAPNMTAMAEGGIVPGMEGGEDPNALLLQQLQAELAKRTGGGAPGIAGMAKGGKVQHFGKGGLAGWVKDVLLGNPNEQMEAAVAAAKTPEEKYAIRQQFAQKPVFESNPIGYWGDQFNQWAEARDAQLKADATAAQQARIAQGLELPPAPKPAASAAAPSATTPPATVTPEVAPDLSKIGTPLEGTNARFDFQLPPGMQADPAGLRKIAMGLPDGADKTNLLGYATSLENKAAGPAPFGSAGGSSGRGAASAASADSGASGIQTSTPSAGQDPTDALRRNYKALRELAGIDKDDEDYKALLAAQRTKVDARNPLELAGLAAISRIGSVQPGRSGWASLGAGLSGLAEGWGQGIASKQQAQDALANAELARVGARGKMNEGIAKVAADMQNNLSLADRLQMIQKQNEGHLGGIDRQVAGQKDIESMRETAAQQRYMTELITKSEEAAALKYAANPMNQMLMTTDRAKYDAGLEAAKQSARNSIYDAYKIQGLPLPPDADKERRRAAVMQGMGSTNITASPAKS